MPRSRMLATTAATLFATLLGNDAAIARDVLAAGARPQGAEAAPASAVTTFTTPDGSRFVLVPDAGMPLVHWAVATPTDDPPRLPGLSFAVQLASLGGTWTTGSKDVVAEQRVLAQQDDAFQAWFMGKDNLELAAKLTERTEAAAQLGDRMLFRRVLASLPAHHPEVRDGYPGCLLLLTTVPSALAEVGRILVERREEPALRDLQTIWVRSTFDRALARTDTAVHAEVLALAVPDHPYTHQMEIPMAIAPTRREAITTWNVTQQPGRTVHVLVGGLDVATTTAMLHRTFAGSALPQSQPATIAPPRMIQSLRRSVVPGLPKPVVAFAFVLPPIVDPQLLEVSARWLGDGPDSHLGQELQRAGRKNARVRCTAPWPATVDGKSLLLLEVNDPDGGQAITDLVLKICRGASASPPSAPTLQAAVTALQRDWTSLSDDPRELAGRLALTALLWPGHAPRTNAPERIDAKAVQALLSSVLAGQPVVVEGRP